MKSYYYIIIVFLLIGCNDTAEMDNIVTKGPRKLSIHITESSNGDYTTNFLEAQKAGMDVVPLTFYWSDLENSQGYTCELLEVADLYYPENNMPISLNISPVAFLDKSFPNDIQGLSFSSEQVISRFGKLLETVHDYLPNAEINNLLIGNEVDFYLNNHPEEWPEFKIFYDPELY